MHHARALCRTPGLNVLAKTRIGCAVHNENPALREYAQKPASARAQQYDTCATRSRC